MSKPSRFTLSFMLAFILILDSGCSLLPKGIQEIFVSATPTSTNTPTPTNTATVTPTATSTPLPPISFASCTFDANCLDALPLNVLLGGAVTENQDYFVTIPYNEVVRVSAGWAAKNSDVFVNNFGHLNWIFEIDGQSYFDPKMVKSGNLPSPNSPGEQFPGVGIGVNMQGWRIGESHQVRIGYTFAAEVSDGWTTSPAGHSVVYTYIISPEALPTATPTATATLTPKPRPTSIPYTKTPACQANASIEITNSTGAYVTLYLKGPTSYTFNIPTGRSTFNVCYGSYSYTAYGCGGASDTGTINSGEAHEFYCN